MMGYTHYWTQSRPLTEQEWSDFTAAARDVVDIARNEGISICNSLGAPVTGPTIDDASVALNGEEGKEDLSHETFAINRQKTGWDFCKTARKPYDKVVTALLIILDKVAPGAFETASDGYRSEWGPGLLLAKAARPGWDDLAVPAGIRG